MLALSRHVGQELVIDGEIRVVITAVEGQRVRLGISAPSHVRIRRCELVSTPAARLAIEPLAAPVLLTDGAKSPASIQ